MPKNNPSNDDDEALALRMAEADTDALRHVLDRHGGNVKAFLVTRYGRVLQTYEIDAAINAAAMKLWHSALQFDSSKGTLYGWFLTIAERAAIDIIRHGRRYRRRYRQAPDDFDPPDPLVEEDTAEAPSTDQKETQQIKQLRWFIENKLVGLQRAIVLADLAVPSGQADDERLAEQFGKTVNNIRVSRHKARENLRKYMLECESQQERLRGKL